jgi:hypothetical protein
MESHTLDELNKIQVNISIDLIWNNEKNIVLEQIHVCKLSGLPMLVTNDMVKKYKRNIAS